MISYQVTLRLAFHSPLDSIPIPVTALFTTKMLVTQSLPDSRKRSRKPEFMLCHDVLKKQDLTWSEFADHFKPSDKQYDRYSWILQTCLKDDAFQTSFTAWRHPGSAEGLLNPQDSWFNHEKVKKTGCPAHPTDGCACVATAWQTRAQGNLSLRELCDESKKDASRLHHKH